MATLSLSQRALYPIDGLLDGWFFRYERLASGLYRIEGIDEDGHTVVRICPERKIDAVLKDCAREARRIEYKL